VRRISNPDSFFGVGLYRIDNADTTATLSAAINPSMTFAAIPRAATDPS